MSESGSETTFNAFATPAGPRSTQVTDVAPPALSTADIYRTLRQIAAALAPQEQNLAVQGLNEWQGRANANPSLLMQQFGPQIRQIQEQLQQAFTSISKRLGPSGGKQIDRDQGMALARSGEALSRLFAGGQQQSTAGMLQFLQSLRPTLLTQLPQLTKQEGPSGSLAGLGAALAAGAGLTGTLMTPQAPYVVPQTSWAQPMPIAPTQAGFAQYNM
jgi:hypothetical protein